MKGNKPTGKIGVFDSGLGGLIILKSIRTLLPPYEYVYFGDTKNLPYGNKTQQEILDLTIQGVKYLINQGCILIIIACNTASAKALRKIQQQWLPKHAPHIRVLGVVVPTIEALRKKDFPAILMATESTVKSKVYEKELNKLIPNISLTGLAAPALVPLIEAGKIKAAAKFAIKLLTAKMRTAKTLVLGCTHYPLLNREIQKAFPNIKIVDQTQIIPTSLVRYLEKHIEIKRKLSKKKQTQIFFTKETATNKKLAGKWFRPRGQKTI